MKQITNGHIEINGYEYLLTPAFRPYLMNYAQRYNVYMGGAGSGKSENITLMLIFKALYYPGRRILCLRKVGRTVRLSLFSVFTRILNRHFLKLVKSINKTDMTITLINDSAFFFGGLDDPEKIKSIDSMHDVLLEEANQFAHNDFSQIKLRLRALVPHSQIYILFNPVTRQNWVYKEFFTPETERLLNGKLHMIVKLKDGSTAFIHKSTYRDNPILPRAYRHEIERFQITNPNYYKIYALGDWGSLGRLIYGNWKVRPHEEIEQEIKDIGHQGERHKGLDFGWNAPSAYTDSFFYGKEKRIYLLDEFKKAELQFSEIFSALRERGVKYNDEIIADSEDLRGIAALEDLNLGIRGAKKGPGSVLEGVKFIMENELIISDRCPEIVNELQNYEWKFHKRLDMYVDDIEKGQDDHLLDALRYSLEDEIRGKAAGFYEIKPSKTPYIVK